MLFIFFISFLSSSISLLAEFSSESFFFGGLLSIGEPRLRLSLLPFASTVVVFVAIVSG
jgi:hypothetical protein